MKTRKKILRALWALIVIAWIVCGTMFSVNERKIKENSTYCMDSIRHELWEYIENIHMNDAFASKWVYVYMWGVSYEWVDYSFSCKVYNKENVDLKLEPIYDICEWDGCDIAGTPVVNKAEEDKALIIVFSPTWHTKEIATYISEIKEIELNELIPTIIYTTEDLDYTNQESRVFHEFKNIDFRPEIGTEFNIDWYDVIYLWYPIWFARIPNIILTLLDNYDLSGKKIVLFCTSWSTGIEETIKYFEPYNLNIIWSKRFAQWSSKEQVQEWLESL